MTVRLYRDDPFLWRFTARVRERTAHNGRPAVVLDRTAFYPAAGGQPHDLGALNGAAVLEVIERDDDEIVHVLDRALPDDEVEGVIDSARRIDHMQQHSGQHVLSQAFVVTANLDTAAVHIGADECTIDLPAARLPDGALLRAEDEANRIVFEDRPIIVRELSDAEAAGLPLRKPPKVTGRIRIVEVQGYDWSACGGTHVRSTAEIETIKLLAAEPMRGGTRLAFVAGGRVRARLGAHEARNARLRATLGAPDEELAAVAEAKLGQLQAAERRARGLEEELAEAIAAALAASPERVVSAHFESKNVAFLQALARRLGETAPGKAALLTASEDDRAFFAVAAGAELPVDVAAAGREVAALLGGRGGGAGRVFQGKAGSLEARPAALARLRELVDGGGRG